jgi:hypothetical protein
MAMNNIRKPIPDAPIPGENYTSDWRNYPWHRPPDISNVDEAVEFVANHLAESDEGLQYMSYLKVGVSVAAVTDMILTLGIADGKWSIDFAILIAGPVARLVTIMAKGYGIEYEMGIDTDADFMPSERLKVEFEMAEENKEAMKQEMDKVAETAEEDVGEPVDEGGLMSPAPDDEQNAMLGYDGEEDEGPDMEEEQI